ncbi:hypothetical protein ACS0TY_006009 [Phlomoides rotata]
MLLNPLNILTEPLKRPPSSFGIYTPRPADDPTLEIEDRKSTGRRTKPQSGKKLGTWAFRTVGISPSISFLVLHSATTANHNKGDRYSGEGWTICWFLFPFAHTIGFSDIVEVGRFVGFCWVWHPRLGQATSKRLAMDYESRTAVWPLGCWCANGKMVLRQACTIKNPGRYFYACPHKLVHPHCFVWCDVYHHNDHPHALPHFLRIPTPIRSASTQHAGL